MINQFRNEMPRPILGVEHSFGGCQIVNLAYLHPRLFTSIILLDPIIQLSLPPMGFGTDPSDGVHFTVHRRDIWPNREAAEASQKKASKTWDPWVLALMVRYGYRNPPTAFCPTVPLDIDPCDPPVTLTTTKHQNALAQLRENFAARQEDGRTKIDCNSHADMDPVAASLPLCRPEPRSTFFQLPSLRPPTMWLVGDKMSVQCIH
ncbi:hypothetical protein ACMFMF_011056 [Clarireedia jacksonii]